MVHNKNSEDHGFISKNRPGLVLGGQTIKILIIFRRGLDHTIDSTKNATWYYVLSALTTTIDSSK